MLRLKDQKWLGFEARVVQRHPTHSEEYPLKGRQPAIRRSFFFLVFVLPFPPECFTERNENRDWSQVTGEGVGKHVVPGSTRQPMQRFTLIWLSALQQH